MEKIINHNRCDICSFGFIYCEWNNNLNMWEEHCGNCGHIKLRKGSRNKDKEIDFPDRRNT